MIEDDRGNYLLPLEVTATSVEAVTETLTSDDHYPMLIHCSELETCRRDVDAQEHTGTKN